MRKDKVYTWEWSANSVLEYHYNEIVSNKEFIFELTKQEMEGFLEHQFAELDGWFQQHLQVVPNTYKFEPIGNSDTDFMCIATW